MRAILRLTTFGSGSFVSLKVKGMCHEYVNRVRSSGRR